MFNTLTYFLSRKLLLYSLRILLFFIYIIFQTLYLREIFKCFLCFCAHLPKIWYYVLGLVKFEPFYD